jgi:starch-binding outer membrane protein, SusD/RagB family
MAALNHKARMAVLTLAATLLVVSTGCDTLSDPLDVEPASRIPAADLEVPGNALLLSDGAVGDFECAFRVYTAMSGLIGEEFIYTAQTLSRSPYDRRATTKDDNDYGVNSCTGGTNAAYGVYTPLQTARRANENVLAFLKTWTDAEVAASPGSPNRTNLMAIAAAYAGYSTVLLGEGFCTMALSSIGIDKSITYGGEIQPDSVFRYAIGLFTEAIAFADAAGNTSIRHMALLGRARAKLNIGDYAGARADAALIPSGYVRVVSASDATTRRQNQITLDNSATNRATSVGEPYRSMTDTRVPVVATTQVSATGILHYYQTKYPTTATPLPLATYEEAQLIIAEADIRSGALGSALLILNASRTRGGQPVPFAGVTQADYLAELVDQRRRELFAESHHLGDIIRYNIPVQPPAGTQSHFGGAYGSQICMPLPAVERQGNPLVAL